MIKSKSWQRKFNKAVSEGRLRSKACKEASRRNGLLNPGLKGKDNPFFGRVHSQETKAQISESRKGQCLGEDNPSYGGRPLGVIRKISETRIKSKVARGKNNPNYKHGKSFRRNEHRQLEMQRFRYREWRRRVFERDDYTCVDCKVRGGDLEADHIKPWAKFPKLRYKVNNGATRCVECHRNRHRKAA
jgi:5-methylcytosine-specific restriction endonuclease McrA